MSWRKLFETSVSPTTIMTLLAITMIIFLMNFAR